ncbi:DUF6804 family protein [Curtobacterium sp. RRHDQ10]|uniref:DUF6804 family protein n=1 Tax=Curtobacterium phyllosphaerae TaxID=3413379 RepID=UPI003BF210D9
MRSGSGVSSSGRRGAAASAEPAFTRPALAPGLLTAVVLLACVALVGSGPFVFVRWGVTVLALIVLVFAVRGHNWIGIAVAGVVVVLWNPLVAIPVPGQVWAALQVVAAAAFIAVGILVKVPRDDV